MGAGNLEGIAKLRRRVRKSGNASKELYGTQSMTIAAAVHKAYSIVPQLE